MIRYESLLLAKTQSTDDDFGMVEREFDKIISESHGTLTSFDKWGKYKLAYPVDGSSHGLYILVRYQLAEKEVAEFSKKLTQLLMIKCNEVVVRYTTIRLAPNAPVTYQRPEPLDIARTGSLDTFLKENKFENMLNSVDNNADVASDTVE